MPLVFLLNGYFRSGTTLLYKIIKQSNPEKLIFYEPFHNDLFLYLSNHKIGQIDKVHNIPLWDEYLLQGKEFIDKLREKHPCINEPFPIDASKVISYLDIFHNLQAQVVLQPNRMHFVLGKIAQYYNVPCAHIIRDPLDTYLDIINTYRQKRNREVVFIADILRKFNLLPLRKAFAMDKGLEFIFRYFGKPAKWKDIAFKIRHYNDNLGIFVVNWVISNYQAINDLEKYNGLLIRYEKLVECPFEVFGELSEFSGIRFNERSSKIILKGFIRRYNYKLVKKFERKITEYGVDREWNYIVKNAGFNYF